MHPELDALIAVLEEQRSCQAELAGLAERKTQAIASGGTQALDAVVALEQESLLRIRGVEQRQEACVACLAAVLGMPRESVTMAVILDRASGDRKDKLLSLRAELTDLIGKLQTLNSVNMKLLRMNLEYAQFMINAAAGGGAGATYGQRGIRKTAGSGRQLLDRKV